MTNTFLRLSVSLSLGLVLSACGGGGDSGAAVTSLSAAPVSFGRVMSVSVSGAGLAGPVDAVVEPGCPSMTRAAGGSFSSQTFTCKLLAIGDVRVRVRDGDGKELGNLRLTVPMPQVTMRVAQGERAGNLVFELDPVRAPKTVENFLDYVNRTSPFHRNTLFHRIDPGVAVYAGAYTSGTSGLSEKTSGLLSAIASESSNGLKNLRGSIAMFHTGDANSAKAQFFVNLADNPTFDFVSAEQPGFAVFGLLQTGFDVLDEIGIVPTESKTQQINSVPVVFERLPKTNVLITSISQTQ